MLSCGPFLRTRVEWMRRAWLAHISPESYVILTGQHDVSGTNVIKLPMGDNYESCPYRYYDYIRAEALEDWDWIVFIDDDTFIFPRRLEEYLGALNAGDSLYVGRQLDWPISFMSGGAGFCLTASAYRQLRAYLLETPREKVSFTDNGDLSLGSWIKELRVTYVNSTRFNGCIATHWESSPLDVAISYHYVTEELVAEYSRLL